MKILVLMLLAALSACVIPIQAIVNGRLGVVVDNRILAALISFLGGTIALTLILLVTQGVPNLSGKHIPWYLCTGGLLGAVFVTAVLSLVPHLGTARIIAATVVGQLIMSLIVDHYGILVVPKAPINPVKVVGGLLLIGGMLLIQYANTSQT